MFHTKNIAVKKMFSALVSLLFVNCVTIAPPGPLMTYGGPKTTTKKDSEAAIGLGTAVALFDGAHSGATGYLGRYKYGISDNMDIGVDFYGSTRNDGGAMAAKIALRHRLSEKSRLEFAIGAADDSDGKSLNTDLAYTIGTVKNRTWNYYASLRGAYAKGFAGNVIVLPGQNVVESDSIIPPDTFFALLNLGTQGKLSENQRIIFEGGYGYIFPKETKSGPAFYFSIGIVFDFKRKIQLIE